MAETTLNPEIGPEFPHFDEVVNAVGKLVLLVYMLALTMFHSYKLYQDFYTAERLSLSHRQYKPDITKGYKTMGFLTLSCCLFYLLQTIAATVMYNFSFNGCTEKQNYGWTVLENIGYDGGKCTFYMVYALRLNEIYGDTIYGYSYKKLICVAVIIIAYNFAHFLFIQITFIFVPIYHEDTDNSWPWYCQTINQFPWVFIGISGTLLFDAVATIASIVAFVVPLNKVVKATLDDANLTEAQQEKRAKMIYIGYKYKVLVFCASFTTFLWIFALFLGSPSIASLLINLDFLVNPVCVLLMTPYYPSEIYYERLCYLCICCCDRGKKSYQTDSSRKADGNFKENEPTATTAVAASKWKDPNAETGQTPNQSV